MADNINVTPGSGATVAADDIQVDGTHAQGLVQFVKLVDGTLNGTEPIATDIGVKLNAVRVAPANDITDATYIGDIKFGESLPAGTNAIGKLAANSGVDIGDVTLTAGTAAIGKLAANSGVDIGDVDILSIIPGVAATSLGKARDSALGATDTGVMALAVRDDTLTTLTPADGDYVPLRVSSTGQLHVTGAGGGTEYTEDVVTANPQVGSAIMVERDDALTTVTPAEADWIGLRGTAEGALWTQDFNSDAALALLGTIDADTGAIKTATELIDDAVYIDDADWSDGSSKHILVGGLYQSSPQTITDGDVGPFQVDADGALHISDGGNTITVDGTVTANLSSTDNTVLDNIQAAVEIMDDWDDANYCNVNINIAGTDAAAGEGAISAQTQRVTIATDDDGVAHLATIAGDTTNIETAVQIIDDWDATHASAAPADGIQTMGAAYGTALPTDVGADADAARLVTDRYGRLCTGLQPQAAKATLDNADTTTAREIVAATATRRIFVTSLIISVDTAGNYWLEDGDATAVTSKMYFAANGGCAITFPEGTPLNTVTQNKALNVKGSTAGNVGVTVTYYLAV